MLSPLRGPDFFRLCCITTIGTGSHVDDSVGKGERGPLNACELVAHPSAPVASSSPNRPVAILNSVPVDVGVLSDSVVG
jgi:hypothetical protein